MQPIHWVKRWCLMRWITRAYEHVLLLLDRGADPSVKAKNGWSMSNALADALSGLDRGSEQYEKLNEIKEKLIQKGGVWPPAPVK